jgi:hypothetical protein
MKDPVGVKTKGVKTVVKWRVNNHVKTDVMQRQLAA